MSNKTKTFGPNITFRDGSTYPLGKAFYDFVDMNRVSSELVDADDHFATFDIVFKDPETGNFYLTELRRPYDGGLSFFGLHNDYITCTQVAPREVTIYIYEPVWDGTKEDAYIIKCSSDHCPRKEQCWRYVC